MTDAVGPGEAARRLGVSTRTVQRWLREGRLAAVKVGAHVKVAAHALPGGADARPIERLLIANRGELVVRIARTCRQLGVRSLALVAQDQARSWWTAAADELVPLEGSYLDAGAVIKAATKAGADAIHPGYGFLAENADFAEQVIAAGLVWVGPPPDAMRALGDKAAARQLATRLGLPVLPGYDGAVQTNARLIKEARRIGYPVLVKPSAGGGGKGMHLLESGKDAATTLARARREAAAAFGDDRLILERYLARPRHVEIQVLVDQYGAAVHLGERECSLQRRHQKVIEEAPSPAVGVRLREQLGAAALSLAREAGYVGAGTAEFLLDEDGSFYFLELNARLQVEHPVTEMLTGRDLVADQLAIAAGRPLDLDQSQVRLNGHAFEARLYAEDARHDFLPAVGEVLDLHWPTTSGVRVDAGVGVGDVIGTHYDPLLAKIIVHGASREAALDGLSQALADTVVVGVTTNRGFLRWLTEHGDVVRGATFTPLIDQDWRPSETLPDEAWGAAATALAQTLAQTTPLAGFRLNSSPRLRVRVGTEERSVAPLPASSARAGWRQVGPAKVVLDFDGESIEAELAPAPTVEAAARSASHAGTAVQHVSAPMPGNVLSVRVEVGDEVEQGHVLIILEAMKMENNVPAPSPGRVARVLVEPGQQVKRGEPLIELA